MSVFNFFNKKDYQTIAGLECEKLPNNLSANQLMTRWRNADKTKGFPVLLKYDDILEETLETASYDENDHADIEVYLKSKIEEVRADPECAKTFGIDTDTSEATNTFLSFGFDNNSPIYLAYVPVSQPWEIFEKLPIGDWNDCPSANLIAQFCQSMYEKYGAVPAVISGDTLELVPTRRPENDEAFELALEMYGFCSDIVTQGVGSVWALADNLKKSDVWYFWWD